MYTSIYGERKVRIFNFSLTVQSGLNDYYRAVNCETFCAYFLRQKLSTIDKFGAKNIREQLVDVLVEILTNYRQKCSANSAPSQ